MDNFQDGYALTETNMMSQVTVFPSPGIDEQQIPGRPVAARLNGNGMSEGSDQKLTHQAPLIVVNVHESLTH